MTRRETAINEALNRLQCCFPDDREVILNRLIDQAEAGKLKSAEEKLTEVVGELESLPASTLTEWALMHVRKALSNFKGIGSEFDSHPKELRL